MIKFSRNFIMRHPKEFRSISRTKRTIKIHEFDTSAKNSSKTKFKITITLELHYYITIKLR